MTTTVTRRNPEYRDGNGFIAQVIRTNRRKTADIRVDDGVMSIVVPENTSLERIDQNIQVPLGQLHGKGRAAI